MEARGLEYLDRVRKGFLAEVQRQPDRFAVVDATGDVPTVQQRLRRVVAPFLAGRGLPVWVRFVLAPGLTDAPDNIDKIARFVAPMKNVEWVEVQPFHQLGEFKWKAMGLDYKHRDTQPPAPDLVNRVIEQFRAAGCNAR